MSGLKKFLVIVEVAVCFIPVSLIWLISLVLTPFQLQILFIDGFDSEGASGSMLVILSTVAGFCGLTAVFGVLMQLFHPEANLIPPRALLLLGSIGFVPLAYFTFTSEGVGPLVFGIPMLVGVHLAYLARNRLFSSHATRS